MADEAKLRAWWSRQQRLDGRLVGAGPAKVLEDTGWARSVGVAAPYIGLYARCGAGREAVDRAALILEVQAGTQLAIEVEKLRGRLQD